MSLQILGWLDVKEAPSSLHVLGNLTKPRSLSKRALSDNGSYGEKVLESLCNLSKLRTIAFLGNGICCPHCMSYQWRCPAHLQLTRFNLLSGATVVFHPFWTLQLDNQGQPYLELYPFYVFLNWACILACTCLTRLEPTYKLLSSSHTTFTFRLKGGVCMRARPSEGELVVVHQDQPPHRWKNEVVFFKCFKGYGGVL